MLEQDRTAKEPTKSHMPGNGKPFVPNDPHHRPGPGRPKRDYLETMRALAWGDSGHRAAVEVIEKALDKGDVRAAQDVLSRAFGKPKETIIQETTPKILTMPDSVYRRCMEMRGTPDAEEIAAEIRRVLAVESEE